MIPAPFSQAVAEAARVAAELGLKVMLLGGFARDACLTRPVSGLARKTQDADLAITVDSWEELDHYLDACEGGFLVDRKELRIRHRRTGVPIDIGPCGGIEEPAGSLRLRGSDRRLDHHGLAEAFRGARTEICEGATIHIPTPAAFVLLKLIAFKDRRASRDLRDVGFVLEHHFTGLEDLLEDPEALEAMAEGTLMHEDAGAWVIGRSIAREFSDGATTTCLAVVSAIRREAPVTRRLILDEEIEPALEIDERIERVDRRLSLLQRSIETGRGGS